MARNDQDVIWEPSPELWEIINKQRMEQKAASAPKTGGVRISPGRKAQREVEALRAEVLELRRRLDSTDSTTSKNQQVSYTLEKLYALVADVRQLQMDVHILSDKLSLLEKRPTVVIVRE